MATKIKVRSTLHARVYETNPKIMSEEEKRRRLKELFLLLYEIDQNNVSKEYPSAQEDK
ncbi:MAG: hypothetical protein WC747_04855 [Candidatus Babeliales bacterium]|jgi:hypothetical protein